MKSKDNIMQMNKANLDDIWCSFLISKKSNVLCPVSKRKLVEHYYPLVKKVAQRLHAKIHHLTVDELTSMGIDGLYDAINKYDPERFKNKFETYAVQRIRGSMLDEIRKSDWVPRLVRSKTTKFQTQRQVAESHAGKKLSSAELATALAITEEEIEEIIASTTMPVMYSVHEVREEDENNGLSINQIEDSNFAQPVDNLMRREFFQKLMSLNFTPQERKIMWLYYFENRCMKEIAEEVGLSESRVSQMHSRILKRLRDKAERNPDYFQDISAILNRFKGISV
jgi:RNA polymerase sigma factor for flagellar operon FliA